MLLTINSIKYRRFIYCKLYAKFDDSRLRRMNSSITNFRFYKYDLTRKYQFVHTFNYKQALQMP